MMLLFILLMLFAIGLHEFGHYITAKMFGIKVEKFFIGFGPKIWSFRRGETEYGFNWIPAGGYVRIAGMNPFEEVAAEDRDRVFKAKKPWQRAIVLVAGSTTHFILAFVVLAGLLVTAGIPDGPITKTVEFVQEDAPAAEAGFRTGDTIVAIGGEPVQRWQDIRDYIRSRPGQEATFTIEREDGTRKLTATPEPTTQGGETFGYLGIQPERETITRGPVAALGESGKFLGVASWESLKALGRIVHPDTITHLFRVIGGSEKRRPDDPTSIVGITRAAGGAGLVTLLHYFIGFNIFVGVANLLPLPPLDGGHLAVLGYEKVRGRDVDMRKLIPVTAAVMAVLISLFVMALYLDIVQPPTPIR